MDIAENIINKYLKSNKKYFIVGICGRAGAGKSTITDKISKELSSKKYANTIYSGDWQFVLDSKTRKKHLEEKWKVGFDAYIYAVNQLTWWDFNKISTDLKTLYTGHSLVINDAYNRGTGNKNETIKIPKIDGGIILYENCILGDISILEKLDLIIFINTSDTVCFERTMKKDITRRNITDIASRFIITTYSENTFFNLVLNKFKSKLVTCNSDGLFTNLPNIQKVSQIPVHLPVYKYRKRTKGTIFCDLDGTLIQHVPIPSESGKEIKILDGSKDKIREWKEEGYYIIMTTSRPYNKVFGVLDKLKHLGIKFDQVICDLPVGPRHLINDSKNDDVRAFAHVLKRDEGIGLISIRSKEEGR